MIISALVLIIVVYAFVKSGCKVSESCYLCFKYKGNKSINFTENKFESIKKDLKYNEVIHLLGTTPYIIENPFYKEGDSSKFEILYENDWQTLYYIIEFNKDSVVISKRVQDSD